MSAVDISASAYSSSDKLLSGFDSFFNAWSILRRYCEFGSRSSSPIQIKARVNHRNVIFEGQAYPEIFSRTNLLYPTAPKNSSFNLLSPNLKFAFLCLENSETLLLMTLALSRL